MKADTEVEILERLRAYIEGGTTVTAATTLAVDPRVYADERLHERQIKAFFLRQPVVAGLSGELAEPGAFKTLRVAGRELLLARDRDGMARAFRNVCRHRGTRLVSERCGARSAFTCPFHGWTYGGAGELRGVPRRETFGPIDQNVLGLASVPLAEKHGLLWVMAGGEPGDTIDPDGLLGPLAAEIEALDLGSHRALGTKDLPAQINWRLAVDTFGETYHFEVLHRHTVFQCFHSNVHDYQVLGRNHRMVFAGKMLPGGPGAAVNYRDSTLTAYFLFPNTQLIVMPHHVDLFQIFPDPEHVGRCLTHYTYFPRPDAAIAADDLPHHAVFDLTAQVIRDEDYATAETAQANLRSPNTSFVFGRNEPALQHYNATFRDALLAAEGRAGTQ